MHVVATAGHVDHGKSTLVDALTGMQSDRLREERERGLSIELGYVWTSLTEIGDVAFVDVPGHERFVTMMLAGVGPVPAVMLVVAADDPWMPQATEHLAALDALQVRHAVVAVTRADLADPGPMMERAAAEVARTTLRGAPVVAVSAPTGAGLPELRTALTGMLAPHPRAGYPGLPVLHDVHGFSLSADIPLPFQLDGEYVGDRTSVTFDCLRSALEVVAPPARA